MWKINPPEQDLWKKHFDMTYLIKIISLLATLSPTSARIDFDFGFSNSLTIHKENIKEMLNV